MVSRLGETKLLYFGRPYSGTCLILLRSLQGASRGGDTRIPLDYVYGLSFRRKRSFVFWDFGWLCWSCKCAKNTKMPTFGLELYMKICSLFYSSFPSLGLKRERKNTKNASECSTEPQNTYFGILFFSQHFFFFSARVSRYVCCLFHF